MKRTRILIADDHAIVAEGLRGLLEPDYEVTGIVADGRQLVDAAERLRPDVILLDISMPSLNGIDAAKRVRKSNPRIKLVFLSMFRDPAYVTEAFRLGASAYVVKQAAASELKTALRAVLDGRSYLSSYVTSETMHALLCSGGDSAGPVASLSSRQREILQLIAEGRTMKEIAALLHVSRKTVEFHKYRLMEVLQAASTADLIRFAVNSGLVA